MQIHEEIELNGKVHWDPSKIQQRWDQTQRHGHVYMECSEKMGLSGKIH
jgi:hypothetical protein